MKRLILVALAIVAVRAVAQTCIVPAPSRPPTPTTLVVTLPADGGTTGCTISSFVRGGASANTYDIGNAKCATAVGMAKQAAAIDNGWGDGGVP